MRHARGSRPREQRGNLGRPWNGGRASGRLDASPVLHLTKETCMFARLLLGVTGLGLLAAATLTGRAEPRTAEPIKLFNGTDLTGWKRFLPPNAKKTVDEIWTVKDGT